jgi:hypothetical protein
MPELLMLILPVLSIPEKRPFFLEGSNIFRTQIQTAYSRMINDPIIAAKLTGKIGDFNIGYISHT